VPFNELLSLSSATIDGSAVHSEPSTAAPFAMTVDAQGGNATDTRF
jgi:hypothetical protein